MNVSEILNKIGVSIVDLAVSCHDMGFASIGVLVEDGAIVDAEITYSVNEVYYDGNWDKTVN